MVIIDRHRQSVQCRNEASTEVQGCFLFQLWNTNGCGQYTVIGKSTSFLLDGDTSNLDELCAGIVEEFLLHGRRPETRTDGTANGKILSYVKSCSTLRRKGIAKITVIFKTSRDIHDKTIGNIGFYIRINCKVVPIFIPHITGRKSTENLKT